jgi:hypothetical protein
MVKPEKLPQMLQEIEATVKKYEPPEVLQDKILEITELSSDHSARNMLTTDSEATISRPSLLKS